MLYFLLLFVPIAQMCVAIQHSSSLNLELGTDLRRWSLLLVSPVISKIVIRVSTDI
jgi:hypothetical protein